MSGSLWGDEIPLSTISVGTAFEYTLPPHVFIRWTDYTPSGAPKKTPYPFAATGARVYAEPIAFGTDAVYDPAGKLRIVGTDARLPKWLETRVAVAAAPLIAHLIDLRTKMDATFGERTLIWLRPDFPVRGEFGIQFSDDMMVEGGRAYRIKAAPGRYEVPLDDRARRFLALAPAIERELHAAILATFGAPLPRKPR
jgi:hypothetical protein